MTRPPLWNPVSVLDDSAWLEVVQVTTEDRVSLPLEIRRRLSWRIPVGKVISLLAVLTEEGSLELLNWEPRGREELARVENALGALDGADRHEALLAAMERYSRATIGRDGRVRLSPAIISHLASGGRNRVWIAASGGRVWLWPEPLWEAARRARFQRLNDLVGSPPPAIPAFKRPDLAGSLALQSTAA